MITNPSLQRQFELGMVRVKKLFWMITRPGHWVALRRGVAPAVEHASVTFKRQYRTILDVGASRGQFALFAAERWPTAEIVCFEPIPSAADILVAVLGDRVSLHRTALGSRPGIATLNISAKDDSSSLLKIDRQKAEYPGTGMVAQIDVSVDKLSNVLSSGISRPSLLKIDVQGYELEVLRGSCEVLDEIDDVLCECSYQELYEGQPLVNDVVAFMAAAGFVLAGVFGVSRALSGEQLQADFLFRSCSR